MSEGEKKRKPPVGHRFQEGQSGNPRGRPKSGAVPTRSAFDILLDDTVTVPGQGDQAPEELSTEEALHRKIYQHALKGHRPSIRRVLKMIEKRERWLAAHHPKPPIPDMLIEPHDPDNANEALIALGIAEDHEIEPGYKRSRLLPWAVQAALSRSGRRRLSAGDIAEIQRCTSASQTLRWPRGARDGQDD